MKGKLWEQATAPNRYRKTVAKNIDAWMKPAGSDKASVYRLLDDRDRPFFENQHAA
jgi:hypothetical protein